MTDGNKRVLARVGVACAVLLSLWLRVAPAWHVVFTPWGVAFQEADAWFHLRTAHNLLAHFPFRSGFDPYALFPGGMNMPTGPLWDYTIATAAWVLGFGSPGPDLTDHVAAWLPALLGSIYPIVVFLAARRLFGVVAGVFAALWIAVTPGDFTWLTHLGNADHHAAEGLFSLLVFFCVCEAVESRFPTRWAITAGVALGALLATQPAGIFVPAILIGAAMFAPSLARPLLYAFIAAGLTLLPVANGLYTSYDWLSLGGGAGVAAFILLTTTLHERKGWPAWTRWAAVPGIAAMAAGAIWMARPALVRSTVASLATVAQPTKQVAEMIAVVDTAKPAMENLISMTGHLGVSWVPALPALLWIAVLAFRTRRAALVLTAVCSIAFTVVAFLHIRMILYYAPFAAMLAGAVCAWLTRLAGSARARFVSGIGMAGVVVAVSLALAAPQMRLPASGVGRDWFAALRWLRENTSEPFAAAAVWNGYFPRLRAGQNPRTSASYGIGVWWDQGYMTEEISQRVPMANGFGAGTAEEDAQDRIGEMARFYANTFGESAVNRLKKLGVRYVIVDGRIPLLPTMASYSDLFGIYAAAGYDPRRSFRVLWHDQGGVRKPMYVFSGDYYSNVGIRLYLFDGKAVRGTGPVVFKLTRDAAGRDVVTGALKFNSAAAAGDYLQAHTFENLMIGCEEPLVSCFDVDAVPGVHRVFTSDAAPLSLRHVNAVKIFELDGDPSGGSR